MRTYNEVYNQSKKEILDRRNQMFEQQKLAIVNVLKEEYMITGKICELPQEQQKEMAKRLREYWSPKTGINANGVRLLNENVITLSKNSNAADIKLFIQKRTKKNLVQILECFRAGRQDLVVESFQEEIGPMIGGKELKHDFIIDTVWGIIGKKMKTGR